MAVMDQEKPSYLDENIPEQEEQSGKTRLPQPNEEGTLREEPSPGREGRNEKDFERPDEFGDGDRRS